jgi:hypothetical protein
LANEPVESEFAGGQSRRSGGRLQPRHVFRVSKHGNRSDGKIEAVEIEKGSAEMKIEFAGSIGDVVQPKGIYISRCNRSTRAWPV